MRKRGGEIVETMKRRRVDICCLQETRWKCGSAHKIAGKDCFLSFSGKVMILDMEGLVF